MYSWIFAVLSAGLGVKPFMHGKKLSCLEVSDFYFFLCPALTTRLGVGVDCLALVLSIQFTPLAVTYSLQVVAAFL